MKAAIFRRKIAGAGTAMMLLLSLLLLSGSGYAQQADVLRVKGTVTDLGTGETLPGVNISIKGTQTGAVTDIYGKYSLDALKGSVLVFSFVGYETTEVTLGSQSTLNVRLKPTVESLEEVVVIGYGLTTRKEVTGSIASVKADDFNRGAHSSPMGLLQGKVAGLSITRPDGADPQAGYQILLRGTNTLTSGQGPLV
ncbi:MAG TPA: carboxypeptidase-like regulatory domain-containing protein, partial [Lentimicrobium sp.]|nr:carboxypeptidase-like regulatory domain-containing protein [Lentimicrobium sp.]